MKAFYSLLLLAAISAQTTAPTPYDPSADKTPIVIKPGTSSTVSGPNTPPMPSSSTPNQPLMPSSTTPNQPLMPSSSGSAKSSSQSTTSSSKSNDAFHLKAAGSITVFALVLPYFL